MTFVRDEDALMLYVDGEVFVCVSTESMSVEAEVYTLVRGWVRRKKGEELVNSALHCCVYVSARSQVAPEAVTRQAIGPRLCPLR